MDLFIFSFVFIAIIEALISGRWNPTYFRVGIPIYSKTLPFEGAAPEALGEEALNNVFRRSLTPSLVFKEIGVGEFAFREKLFQFVLLTYTPIMHGRLEISSVSREVRVIGLLNWWILAFVLTSLTFFSHSFEFVPFLFLLLGVIYLFQKSKYDKVGRFTAQWTSLTASGGEAR
jgi:hypothetical protein